MFANKKCFDERQVLALYIFAASGTGGDNG